MTTTAQDFRFAPTSPNRHVAVLLSLWKTILAELLCRTTANVN
jgi:hypothetical protein